MSKGDRLCALSRSVDAVIRWHATPKWRRRGSLAGWVRRAYHRPVTRPATRDATLISNPTKRR